ncbi:MAG: hypothetical protein ABIX01_13070 [Chitinophagaceae bacterium]
MKKVEIPKDTHKVFEQVCEANGVAFSLYKVTSGTYLVYEISCPLDDDVFWLGVKFYAACGS